MKARISNDEVYTIYMERNANVTNDTTIKLILNIPYYGEPIEFFGNPDVNGEITFDSYDDNYITYEIIDEAQLENSGSSIKKNLKQKDFFTTNQHLDLYFITSRKIR